MKMKDYNFLNQFDNILLEEDRISIIYRDIDQLLRLGLFELVDSILFQIDCSKFSVTSNLAFLSITSAAKENLQNREDFYNRFKNYLILIGKSKEKIDELLRGLE